MMENEQQSDLSYSSNVIANQMKKQNDYNIIQVRLDTEPYLQKIQVFLSGQMLTYGTNEHGEIVELVKEVGYPRANKIGIQNIMSIVSGIFNSAIVQGNFLIDKNGRSIEYERYVTEAHIAILDAIAVNSEDWEIKDDDITPIIRHVMLVIIPFMSRLIGNLERMSYSDTIRHVESSKVEHDKKGWNPFKK